MLVLPGVGVERLLVLSVCLTATVGAVVTAVSAVGASVEDVVVHGCIACRDGASSAASGLVANCLALSISTSLR